MKKLARLTHPGCPALWPLLNGTAYGFTVTASDVLAVKVRSGLVMP